MKRLSLAHYYAGRRSLIVLITAMALVFVIGSGLALAQDNATHKIKVGDTVTGTLDAKTAAQVYSFDAHADDTVTLTATNKAGLVLILLVTDANGNAVTQTASSASPQIKDLKIAADGTYYVIVTRSTGMSGSCGTFTLALTGTTSVAGTTVALDQGMKVDLNWSTEDDFNLEVRDPVGNAVNFRSPKAGGGELTTGNINSDCTKATPGNNVETVSYPKGTVPSGSYEIIVYFNQACAQAAAGQTPAPVDFTVTVTVNGNAQDPIRGTLNLSDQYVASFILDAADKVTVQQGGINSTLALNVTPFSSKIGSPTDLGSKTSVTGTIDRNNPADAYSFTGKQGQNVTIDLAASSGSLDPLVVLLDPSNNVITSNDDANANTRASEILNQPLTVDGKYTILATRFALQIGGTEGNYSLKIKLGTGTTTSPTVVPTSATAAANSGALPQTNVIAISLTWDSTADLRLLVRDPSGVSIYSDVLQPSATSGIMARTGNLACKNTTTTPIDYIYWPNETQPAAGAYEVNVWQNSACNLPATTVTTYTLTASVGGKTLFEIKQRPDLGGAHFLTTFTIDDSGNGTQGKQGIFSYDITKNAQFSKDLPNLLQNATALAYNTPVTGTIDTNTPYVIYTMKVIAGDKLRITMLNRKGNLDPLLYLLKINGSAITLVDFNDDATPGKDANSLLGGTKESFTADGDYVIVATHYGIDLGGTVGDYELTVTKLNR